MEPCGAGLPAGVGHWHVQDDPAGGGGGHAQGPEGLDGHQRVTGRRLPDQDHLWRSEEEEAGGDDDEIMQLRWC